MAGFKLFHFGCIIRVGEDLLGKAIRVAEVDNRRKRGRSNVRQTDRVKAATTSSLEELKRAVNDRMRIHPFPKWKATW